MKFPCYEIQRLLRLPSALKVIDKKMNGIKCCEGAHPLGRAEEDTAPTGGGLRVRTQGSPEASMAKVKNV